MAPCQDKGKRCLTCGKANEDVKTEDKMELCFSHRLLSEVLLDILVLLRGGVIMDNGHAGVAGRGGADGKSILWYG